MNERLTHLKIASPGWLAEAFEQTASLAPPAFLGPYQKEQFDQFNRRGFPTRREEAWKYNDLSFLEKPYSQLAQEGTSFKETETLRDLLKERSRDNELLVFLNGIYAPQLSQVSDLGEGVILCNLQEALKTQAPLIKRYLMKEIDPLRHPFASLNAAFFNEGLFLYVPREKALERPLHVLFLSQGQEGFMTHPRHLLILEEGAHLNLTEEYRHDETVPSFTNVCADFFVGRDAILNYHKIQNGTDSSKQIASLFFHQNRNSQVKSTFFAVDGQFTRNDVTFYLQEAYASCQARGLYGLERDGQLIDNHIYMNHSAPFTRSDLDFRGLVSGRSRAVFNGKVEVHQDAKKTQARQMNHNLLLSDFAEVDSKPELEIYTDEVECRHGATTGQLDEEALFYLRSRGIDSAKAKVILLQAFVETLLSEVSLPQVSDVMRDLWGRQLARL